MSVVSTAAEAELITAAEAREWCRADSSHDTFFTSIIPACRRAIESYTGRALVSKTLVDRRDGFPCSRLIKIEQPPLLTVSHIKYDDENGAEQTLSTSLYTVDIYSSPGRIALNPYESWPFTIERINSVRITYTAGYVANTLPGDLKTAIMFFIAHIFSNREPYMAGLSIVETPETLKPMFFPYKVNW